MIKVRNITKIYKDKKVLYSFSYKFNKKGLYIKEFFLAQHSLN